MRLRRGYDEITVASCGNYGTAVALAASLAGLRCMIYIPEGYYAHRVKEIARFGAEIIRVPGDYEEAVKISRIEAEKEGYYDANPGGSNTNLQLKTYGEIAYEIYDELRDAPAAVARSSIEWINFGRDIQRLRKSVQSWKDFSYSPLYRRLFLRNESHNSALSSKILHKCMDLKPERIRNTSVNEPLINWRSIDGDYALSVIRQTRGWASFTTDKILLDYSRLIREKEGLSVLPASTAGLVALVDRHRKEPFPGDRYVVILTGRKA